MSGGAYKRVFQKIEEIEIENADSDPRRRVFQQLLKLVAEAMHDIEWVDSDDMSPGDEYPAIDRCFAFIMERNRS